MSEQLKEVPYDWRFERKFFIDDLGLHKIENEILRHPACFIEAYAPRRVNNIYFDTAAMVAFRDNVEGVAARKKNRIRWYGETFGHIKDPVLEYKIKQGFLGRKEHFSVPAFNIDTACGIKEVMTAINSKHLPDWVILEMKNLKAKLLNTYKRKYYLSADGRFRLTLDTELKFAEPDDIHHSFVWRKTTRENAVVELKYSSADNNDKEARNITSKFQFRMTKSSKYVIGIESLFHRSIY